jgi:hypothetical protein
MPTVLHNLSEKSNSSDDEARDYFLVGFGPGQDVVSDLARLLIFCDGI